MLVYGSFSLSPYASRVDLGSTHAQLAALA